MHKKILLFGVLSLFSISSISKDIFEQTDKAWSYWDQDNYVEIENLLPSLEGACIQELIEDEYIYCQSFLLSFNLFASETTEEYDKFLSSMKKLLKNSILTKENNYSKLDLLDSYLSAIFIDDLDHNFFLSLLNKLKPQGEIDFEYSQNWASLNAKYARNLEDKLTELEHLNNVINYSKEIGAKRWETLRAQIYKSYTLMDLNRFYESKITALEVIQNSNVDSLIEYNLEGWLVLNLLERLYGNTDDEFLYLRIFMEKYYIAVLNKGLWLRGLDGMYLNNFDEYIYLIECNSVWDALVEFDAINEIRKTKTTESIEFTMPTSVKLAIHREIYACASIENDELTQKEAHEKLINLLQDFIEEEMASTLDYNLVINFLIELDHSKKQTIELFFNYRAKANEYIESIINDHKRGIIDADTFSQFHVHSLVEILFQNLDFLTEDEIQKNFEYAKYLIEVMVTKDEVFNKTFAYEGILLESVVRTHKMGYEEYSKDIFAKYFSNKSFKQIVDQSSLFDNLEFMALAEIYARVTAKNNSQDHLNIIIQNLNKVNRGSLEISLTIEQTDNRELKRFLKLKMNQENARNKFFASEIDYKNEKKLSLEDPQIYVQNILSQSQNLSESSIMELQKILYPEIKLKDVQNRLSASEGLVAILNIPTLNTGVETFITLLITKNEIQYQYLNSKDVSIQVFSDLTTSIAKYSSNNSLIDIQSRLDTLSKSIYGSLENEISKLSKLTFISNFDNSFNPYLLRINGKWLIEQSVISSQLNLNSFLASNYVPEKKSKYFGIGNINYSNHDYKFMQLEETKEEIILSSRSFKKSKLLLQDSGNMDALKSLNFESSQR